MNLDSSLIISSVTASQGSCGTSAAFTCDLGSLATGTSATVTVSAIPTNSGTLAGTANLSSTSSDPNFTNNQSTTSTTITGNLYGAVPVISAISPNLVQAGSADFALTVKGTGFNVTSTINSRHDRACDDLRQPNATHRQRDSGRDRELWLAGGDRLKSHAGRWSLTDGAANDLHSGQRSSERRPLRSILHSSSTLPSPAPPPTLRGNSVVSINPSTGAVGTPVAVGSQPTVMAETADGNYLYIGLSGADSLAQFNLLTGSVTATIPLTYASMDVPRRLAVRWQRRCPVLIQPWRSASRTGWGNFGIFDVSGNTGSFRPNVSVEFTKASTIQFLRKPDGAVRLRQPGHREPNSIATASMQMHSLR